jgi:subtilisin family serine protease
MKKNLLIVLTASLLLHLAGPTVNANRRGTQDEPKYVPDEIIVKFRDGISEEQIKQINQRHRASISYKSPVAAFRRIKLPADKTALQMCELYKSEPVVEYAQLNYYVYANLVPNDPLYSYQWNFSNSSSGINIEPVWDITAGDPNVIVAVVDTGIAYEDYNAPSHWHIDTYRAYGGGHSWWCGQNNPDWATPPGYGNGWRDYLQHSFDLTGAAGTVTLSYQYRHDLEVTAGVAYDKAYTEVSTDGGASWTILKTYTGKSLVKGKVGWKAEILDLTGYKGSNILVRFRVYSDEIYSDEDGYFNSDGAFFVDEIKLKDASGVLFYDNVESGPGEWETTRYGLAPDLTNTLFTTGYDFINDDEHANDDNRHGTHVAGTIAQSTNNALGVAGIAFNCRLMPVKVLDSSGTGTSASLAEGISYAANNNAKVINMSLGFPPGVTAEDIPAVTAAVQQAYQKGCILVGSSGNDGGNVVSLPAAYPEVIAVGATNSAAARSSYSQYGPELEIVAPGGDSVDRNGDGYIDGILQQTFGSTPKDWGYWFFTGTSMAAPHVSGIAALLVSTGVTDPNEVREALHNTAKDLGATGWDQEYGWGLVDAYAALNYFHIPADFDYDGSVDFDDLRTLSTSWLEDNPAVDIAPEDGDGIVNFCDFAKFAESWNQ